MNIDKNIVLTLLQEKGILDFKPFILYDKRKFYAYRKEEHGQSIFHFCDEKLQELERKDIGLCGALFILVTDDSYSFSRTKLYTEMKDINEHGIQNDTNKYWLINKDNTIIDSNIREYFAIAPCHYVLETSIIDLTNEFKHNIWYPKDHYYWVYDEERNDISQSNKGFSKYYGSINFPYIDHCHILEDPDKGIYVIDSLGNILYSQVHYLWHLFDRIYAIRIEHTNDSSYLVINHGGDTQSKISIPIKLNSSYDSHFNFYSDGMTLCCIHRHNENVSDNVKQPSSNIFILSRFGRLIYSGTFPYSDHIVNMENGIIVVEDNFNKIKYLDRNFFRLGVKNSAEEQFVVVEGNYYNVERYELDNYDLFQNKCSEDFAKFHSNFLKKGTLYGVLDTFKMKLIIPIRYDKIQILCQENCFCAIVALDCYGLRYGLFYNDNFLLQITNDEITVLDSSKNNLIIRWSSNGHCGLICNGKIIFNNIYDSIEYDSIDLDGAGKYFRVRKNNKWGIYNPESQYLSPIQFCKIDRYMESIIIADNNIYQIADNTIRKLTSHEMHCDSEGNYCFDSEDYCYSCHTNRIFGHYVFKRRDGLSVVDYKCYIVSNNESVEVSIEVLNPDDIPEFKGYHISKKRYLIIDKYLYYDTYYIGFVSKDFIIETAKEIEREKEEDKNFVYYDEDDTDYERETFYALGGDDYDEWRDNGGNLDDMMDGLGY